MEYTETFEVTRYLHGKPAGEVAQATISLYKEHPGLRIRIQVVGDQRIVDCERQADIIELYEDALWLGSLVSVTALSRNGLEEEVLRNCVNEIRTILTTVDERTLTERAKETNRILPTVEDPAVNL